jgi:hypothetical protein
VTQCTAGPLALAAALAMLCIPAAAAQQPTFEPAPGEEGIVVEKLDPLASEGEAEGEAEGEGEATRDGRFKPAPFKTPEVPMVPELIPPVETVQKAGARLRQLDKMTGQSETVEVAAGEEVMLDRLRVRLEACRAPEDNGEHGTMAFLKIWDSKETSESPVFSGWMFAESPALSAMDHARYDVWVMSCTTVSGDGSTASR